MAKIFLTNRMYGYIIHNLKEYLVILLLIIGGEVKKSSTRNWIAYRGGDLWKKQVVKKGEIYFKLL